jgi:hypothetical protein
MQTALEWQARELGVSRRSEAEQSMLVATARLTARRHRLQRRQERLDARLAGNPINAR